MGTAIRREATSAVLMLRIVIAFLYYSCVLCLPTFYLSDSVLTPKTQELINGEMKVVIETKSRDARTLSFSCHVKHKRTNELIKQLRVAESHVTRYTVFRC